ncbi:MAG: hypothetical protein IPJ31_03180 [Bacteroidetes bacterium]|nr:hypothetical protein [Bacteroidota bacterium]
MTEPTSSTLFIHNPCGENINVYSHYFGSPYSKFVSVSTAIMDAKDVYEKNSVLKEFVKTLEPDIADKELQGFINDFLGIKEEVKEVALPLSEPEPAPTTVNNLNQQNQVLIDLLKEAVFQFLEKKYQEEKAYRKPLEQHQVEDVEKEEDVDSYQLVEELGSMGISKISPDTYQLTPPTIPNTLKKHPVKSSYFIAFSVLGMFLLLAFLIVIFNRTYNTDTTKAEGNAMSTASATVFPNDTTANKATEATVSSSLNSPVSPPAILNESLPKQKVSEITKPPAKENKMRANDDNEGLTSEGSAAEPRSKNRFAPKKGAPHKATKAKKSTQHEQVYFAEQE